MTRISKSTAIKNNDNIILLCSTKTNFNNYGLSKAEIEFVKNETGVNNKKFVCLNQLNRYILIQLIEKKEEHYLTLEALRKAGNTVHNTICDLKIENVSVIDTEARAQETLAFTEGLLLSNYQFLKYKNKKETHSLRSVTVYSKKINDKQISELETIVEATCIARTLVNEPANYLTATQLSKEFQKLGKQAGFNVEVFNKEKIKALKMGGLLSVNLGSIEPPTFSIMEYKPKNAKNKQPIILVGKGVVYDTGGVSLKPTPNSMDLMKSDMAGAAAVGGTMYAVAKANLPIYVIGIVPATDNRPGENAYVPGDVITMYNGMTVEMLNADAEGRMILADALAYAQKYNPQLVIDLATLTGAAIAAVGTNAIAGMGTANKSTMEKLLQSGMNTFERIAEMPFWEDYDELLKSDIADMKNIGGPYAGAITAGKFLQHFTQYPWIHLDIAGPSFLTTKNGYRGKGGTGVGVRLLFDYLKNKAR